MILVTSQEKQVFQIKITCILDRVTEKIGFSHTYSKQFKPGKCFSTKEMTLHAFIDYFLSSWINWKRLGEDSRECVWLFVLNLSLKNHLRDATTGT